MPRRIGELTETGIIAEMRAEMRRLWRAVGSNQGPVGEYDEYTLTSSTDSAHTLTYIPSLSLIPIACLNGLPGRYGADYTVDFSTGIVTWSATKVAGDILSVFYQTTGDLVALSGPADGGLTDLTSFTQDGGTWSLDGSNRFYVSASSPLPTRFQSSSLGWYMIRHDLGKASIDLTVDVNHIATNGPEQIFCAFDPAVGSGYAILWDPGSSFNGGLTLYRYPSDTGSKVALGNASATPVDTGWGDNSFTHTVHLRLTYNSSTGALAAYWGLDGATPTLRISATDASPLTGHWFGAAEFNNNTGFGRWVNWAAT